MDEIIKQVFRAIDELQTVRIVGVIPTQLLSSENYLSDLIEPLVTALGEKQKVQLIAVDVYPQKTFFLPWTLTIGCTTMIQLTSRLLPSLSTSFIYHEAATGGDFTDGQSTISGLL